MTAILVTIESLIISKNKWAWQSVWKPLIFGLIYLTFALIYWSATNVSIYRKFLDFGNYPILVTISILGSVLLVLFIHVIFTFIKNKIIRKKETTQVNN